MNQDQQNEINLNLEEIQKQLTAAQTIIKKIQHKLHRAEHKPTESTQQFPREKK